jgi:hypothetical protein
LTLILQPPSARVFRNVEQPASGGVDRSATRTDGHIPVVPGVDPGRMSSQLPSRSGLHLNFQFDAANRRARRVPDVDHPWTNASLHLQVGVIGEIHRSVQTSPLVQRRRFDSGLVRPSPLRGEPTSRIRGRAIEAAALVPTSSRYLGERALVDLIIEPELRRPRGHRDRIPILKRCHHTVSSHRQACVVHRLSDVRVAESNDGAQA